MTKVVFLYPLLYFFSFPENTKKEDLLVFFLMREMGLEPTRKSIHMILSHACLPIPALPLIQFVLRFLPNNK